MRCKLYSLLLPAYTILDDRAKCDGLIRIVQTMLPAVKAHGLVGPWRNEVNPKRSKEQLIKRLSDYDRCLGHLKE